MNISNFTRELSGNTMSISPFLIGPLAVVILLTVVGNLLVILAVARTPQLQNTTSVFIMSLACADLIVGCVVQPMSLAVLLIGNWPLNRTACDLWTSVDVLCVTASTQTLCAIAVDRYVAITRPLRYKALLHKWRARFIVCAVWMISVLVSFVPIMGGHSRASGNFSAECYKDERCCDFLLNETYAIISSIISFYIPLLVMLFVYGQVFLIATRQVKMIYKDRLRFSSSDSQQLTEESSAAESGPCRNKNRRATKYIVDNHRALKTLGLIMGVFTLCWLPFFVANITVAFKEKDGNEDINKQVMVILNWLGYINSGLNPIIYCHSSDYYAAIQSLLHLLKIKRATLEELFGIRCPCRSSPSRVRVSCSQVLLHVNGADNSTRTPAARGEATVI